MADTLDAEGVYLPETLSRSGRRGAHHGIANAFKGPRALRDNQPMLDDLRRELNDSGRDTFCVSSEDFETHLMRQKVLKRLADLAQDVSARPVIVLYLRNQADYFESLYLQLLRTGSPKSASEALDEVEETGQLSWRRWVFHFDYAALVRAIDTAGMDLAVRNYHGLAGGSSTTDFLDFLDLQGLPVPEAGNRRANVARVEGNIRRFATNRLGEVDPQILQGMDDEIDGIRPVLSGPARDRLHRRFAEGNQTIAQRFGFDLSARFTRPDTPEKRPLIDEVFEQATIDRILALQAGKVQHV